MVSAVFSSLPARGAKLTRTP